MLLHKIIVLIFICILFKLTQSKKYDNYTLYRGMPVNEQHLEFFKNISEIYDVNYWRQPSTVYRPVEFVIPPEQITEFLVDARKEGVYLTTIIADVQSAFDKQTVKSYIRRNMASFDWKTYFRLKDIYSWLRDVAKMYPNQVTTFPIGKTNERRDIMAVKVLLKGAKPRSVVIVEGGIHAREWIGPAFVTYLMYQIVKAPFSTNKELQKIAMSYEWYFVPVLNPDGYEYSHTEDRLWRKNRGQKHGVDVNRNFGYGFGTVGVSHKKDSEIYCGPHSFSEKESQAMAALVKAKSDKLEYYLGFHSYGQYMIVPYANSKTHSDNFEEVKQMGVEAAKVISKKFGTKYTIGTAYDTVGYTTSGVSGCWVKKMYKVPYVMTFELRDNGEDGFALPPMQILPTCQETLDGVMNLLTPRTKSFKKLKMDVQHHDGQNNVILDKLVIVCNALFFIIVRFY